MKKHLLVLLSLFIAALTVQAERISQEDAALVANNFMNVASATGVKKSVQPMKLKKAASATENQYYVYENANGEGWVIVAADDAIAPILAYSKTGQFRTDNMPLNIRKWLGKYDNFIKKVVTDGVVASEEAQAQWKKLRKGLPDDPAGTIVVGPLVQTQWDQGSPYNDMCPSDGSSRAATGCVATAMAQVMKYWEWPVQGTGSHTYQPLDEETGKASTVYGQQTANFGATTYDWANMKKKHTTKDTQAQKTAIATLLYHCGVGVEMMYGPSSGAYTGLIDGLYGDIPCAENALKTYFGYNSSTIASYLRDGYKDDESGYVWRQPISDANWMAMLKKELDNKRPIMYAGAGDVGGHSFICDGYDSENYFHFNWGWSGHNDGWYLLSNVAPGSGGIGGGSYDFNEEQDIIIGIIPDKPNRPDVNVTWMADGQQFDKTVASSGILSLPTNTPANCESGKVFKGWTPTQNYESEATAPTYVKAGEILDADATYYAVYASKSEGAENTTTVSMESIGDVKGSSNGFGFTSAKGSGSSNPTYNSTAKDLRLYAGNTLIIDADYAMTKIVFNISAQGLKRLAPITANVGTIATQASGDTEVTWTGSATSVTFTVGAKADYGTDGSSKAGQLDFTSVDITAIGGATYSNFSTACGAAVVCELTGIELNTDKVQKEFVIGSTFNYDGLVVTASYSNCGSKTVTPKSVSTPDMSAAGKKTVTVTYEENSVSKTATYEINVKEVVKHTITYVSCGNEFTKQLYNDGEALALPDPAPEAQTGKVFYGWIAEEQYTGSTAPTLIEAGAPVEADATYYAVFATVGEGGGAGSTTTVVMENIAAASGTNSGFTFEAGGSGTAATYNTGFKDARYYAGNTLTISCTNEMTKIVFKLSTQGLKRLAPITASEGEIATQTAGDEIVTWSGSATSVTFTVGAKADYGSDGNSKAGQLDFTSVDITTGGGGSSYSNYSTTCDAVVVCELTGITLSTDNVQKEFTVGDKFSTNGLEVTANYSNCESKLVTDWTVSTPDMNKAGEQTITVTYEGKTATYKINVKEIIKFTVTYISCGDEFATQEYNEGENLVLPDPAPGANAGKAFYGWIATEHYTGTAAPTLIEAGGEVKADAVYYAVYKK